MKALSTFFLWRPPVFLSLPWLIAHSKLFCSGGVMRTRSPLPYFLPVTQLVNGATTRYSSASMTISRTFGLPFISEYVPANSVTWPSLTSTTLVHTVSRKYLSWVTVMTVPSYSLRASSMACFAGMSR